MQKHIIFGVLNWGLGHATRSKVIIDALLKADFQVTLASDGAALQWLKKEYPDLTCLTLPSYNIRYARYVPQWLVLALRAPLIWSAVRKERRRLRRFVVQNQVQGIISDNRLGFYHPEIPSVYMTHQVHLKAGPFSGIAERLHRQFIERYQECWVPDRTEDGLSGELSADPSLAVPVRFIGPLSRFREADPQKEQDWIMAVLSGPEPQRSLLQRRLLRQMGQSKESFTIIAGSEGKRPKTLPKNVRWKGRLNSGELERLMRRAKLVISRSGYSSIMDYCAMQKKALLVPTPGQGEQIYLAKKHQAEGRFHCVEQKQIDLSRDLEKALALPIPKITAEDPQWSQLFGLFQRKRKG